MFLYLEPAQIFFFLLEHLSALLVAIFAILYINHLHNEEQNEDHQEPKPEKDEDQPVQIESQPQDDQLSFTEAENPKPNEGLETDFISKTFKLLGPKFPESKYAFMPICCLNMGNADGAVSFYGSQNNILKDECKKVGDKILMIPIYDHSRVHYVLFLLDEKNKQYCVLDSLFDKGNESYKKIAENYLKSIKYHLGLEGEFSRMSVKLKKQKGCIDCGRFVIMYAIALASQKNGGNMKKDLKCLTQINQDMVGNFQTKLETLFKAYIENKAPGEKTEALNQVIEAVLSNSTSESTGQTLI